MVFKWKGQSSNDKYYGFPFNKSLKDTFQHNSIAVFFLKVHLISEFSTTNKQGDKSDVIKLYIFVLYLCVRLVCCCFSLVSLSLQDPKHSQQEQGPSGQEI